MAFNITLCKFSLLTLLIFVSVACDQTNRKVDNTNKVDTGKTVIAALTPTAAHTDSVTHDSVFEQKIIDTILKLKEVKERAKYIEQQTKGDRHLLVWIEDTPHLPEQDYYWIKAGEDNGTNLVTHFNFYVYPDSMRIMYYDTVSDSTMTLNDWRKINGM